MGSNVIKWPSVAVKMYAYGKPMFSGGHSEMKNFSLLAQP